MIKIKKSHLLILNNNTVREIFNLMEHSLIIKNNINLIFLKFRNFQKLPIEVIKNRILMPFRAISVMINQNKLKFQIIPIFLKTNSQMNKH
jgi:hypothetical protein